MPIVSVGPDYLDDEVFVLMQLLKRGGWAPHEVAIIERAIQRRSEEVRAGLTSFTARYWTEKIQREIDDRTRMRWDFVNGWVLDRWAEGRWQVAGVFGFNNIRPWLIDYLRERDMQRWPSPEAYLEHKREQALRVQIANEYANTQKLMTVVDKMSDKQVKEFITVETAMRTGETVTLHGASEKMFKHIRKGAFKARATPPPSGQSINPGMHPFKYVRHRKDR